jgi:hypothetical protein
MECERLHGATDGGYPITFISQQSSAYCTGVPSLAYSDFFANFRATYGPLETKSGWGTDVLGTATAVSLYFTTTTTSGSVAQRTATTTSGGNQSATGSKASSGTVLASGTTGAGGVRVVGMGACLGTVLVVMAMAVIN